MGKIPSVCAGGAGKLFRGEGRGRGGAHKSKDTLDPPNLKIGNQVFLEPNNVRKSFDSYAVCN